MSEEREKEWHLTKGVTLTLILALVVYGIVLVWYASQMDSTMNQYGRDIDTLFSNQREAAANANAQAVALGRIEENTRGLGQQLETVNRQLERLSIETREASNGQN